MREEEKKKLKEKKKKEEKKNLCVKSALALLVSMFQQDRRCVLGREIQVTEDRHIAIYR